MDVKKEERYTGIRNAEQETETNWRQEEVRVWKKR